MLATCVLRANCPSQDVSVLEPVSVDSDSESNPDSESTAASEATTVIDVDEIINQQTIDIQNFHIAPADADGMIYVSLCYFLPNLILKFAHICC